MLALKLAAHTLLQNAVVAQGCKIVRFESSFPFKRKLGYFTIYGIIGVISQLKSLEIIENQ